MFSATFPDWKRIGRRIGKRLKDVLGPNPNDPSPSVEERRAQRLRDALVGLVYLDTFEELESWQPADVDPIQQANQPLLSRSSTVHNQNGPRTKLLLCHDYKGGYHEYESVRPSPLNSEPYNCKHLQYVDTFIYFSHKLVCIPPSTWINTLHRHGVKVLGTFLIERQTPHMESLLTKTDGKFTAAKQLVDMADVYGFDGWLLNIEQDAPIAYPNWQRKLMDFLNELHISIGKQKKVLWYDALTTDGDVYYQNGLTSLNRPYVQSTSGLFTNYKWTEKKLTESKISAENSGMPLTKVFFGIDVWAQNTDMPGPPRVTYPPEGGGGTNTGLAMSLLSSNGFPSAVFGPAWAYEHFSTSSTWNISSGSNSSIAHQVDDSMWAGIYLPDELGCDCRKGKPHHTDFYQSNPIIEYALEYPQGSSRFFETRFVQACRPFNEDLSSARKLQYWPTLGSQDPIPNLIPLSAKQWQVVNEGPIHRVLHGELRSEPQASLGIFTKLAGCYEEDIHSADYSRIARLCLYKLAMTADGSLEATVEAKCKLFEDIPYGIYLAYADRINGTYTYFDWDMHLSKDDPSRIPIQHEDGVLVEIGVYVDTKLDGSIPLILMEITRIVIKPKQKVGAAYAIRDVRTKDRGQLPHVQKRITWTWERIAQGNGKDWPQGIPWSRITGPFSSFTIRINGRDMGEVYCLEFPLKNSDVENLGDEVTITVLGHTFGAGDTTSPSLIVPKAHLITNSNNNK